MISQVIGCTVVLAALITSLVYEVHLRRMLKRERLRHVGARWLANNNHLRMAATQDWAMKALNLSARDFYDGVRPMLRGGRYLSQMINLGSAPKAVLPAAVEFNRATDELTGTEFAAQWLDTDQERRMWQLETAVARLTGKNYEDYGQRVAEEAGMNTATVQLALLTYTSMVNEEVEQFLGTLQDPEEILPSIY